MSNGAHNLQVWLQSALRHVRGGPRRFAATHREGDDRRLSVHGAEQGRAHWTNGHKTSPRLNFPPLASEAARMTPTATLPRNDRRLVFTSSQAARYLGVSLATIRRWTDAGHISCYRTPGGQRRFAREQLDVFVTSMYRDSNAGDEDYGNGGAPVHGASAA
jgi:excisionase family DNA binding protein